MKELNNNTTHTISAGTHQNVVYCDNGYLSSKTAIPPHNTEEVVGFVIAIPGTDAYKKIENFLPKVV